jgi:hypothetical protein
VLLVEEFVEVVHEVCGSVAVVGKEDVNASHALHNICGIKRIGSTDQLIKMDGRAYIFQTFFQFTRKFGVADDTLQIVHIASVICSILFSAAVKRLCCNKSLTPWYY